MKAGVSVRALFIALLLAVCSGCIDPSLLRPGASPLPEWVRQVPVSEDAYYGLGQGITFREAEKDARAAIASQIDVRVSSEVRHLQTRDGDYYNEVFRSDTRAYASETAIVNAVPVQRDRVDNTFYVLVRADKQALVIQQQSELRQDLSQLQPVLERRPRDSFSRWWELRRQAPLIRRIERNQVFLAAVGQPRDRAADLSLQRYRQQLNAADTGKILAIQDRSRINGLASEISRQLSDAGIRTFTSHSHRDTRVQLETRFDQRQIGQETYLDGTLDISLVTADGSVLARHTYTDKAVVFSNNGQGVRQINQGLYRQVRQDNVLDTLIQHAD